jgi:HSP20 family molecular chaperone IbpA
LEEPSITWVIQRPASNQAGASTQPPAPTKPETNDESTVVHRNSAIDSSPFSVQVKLPSGIAAENVQVRVQDNVLFVAGEKRVARDNFVQSTSFARQFPVGANVDTDKMSAVINPKGVLVISAPTVANALPSPSDSASAEKPTENKEESSAEGESEPRAPATATDVAKPEAKPVAAKETQPIATKVKIDTSEPPVLVPFKLQVSQNDDKVFVVTIELPPGVTAKDVDLQVSKGVLSISGEQRNEYNGSVLTSKFVRHFVLDKTAEVDKITATLDDQTRVLTVTVPKKAVEEPTVQKIAINVGNGASPSVAEEPQAEEKKDESSTVDQTPAEEKPLSEETSSSGSKDEGWTDVEKTGDEEAHVEVHVDNK